MLEALGAAVLAAVIFLLALPIWPFMFAGYLRWLAVPAPPDSVVN